MKRLLILLPVVALTACGSDVVTPEMIKVAQASCATFGGLASFTKGDTNTHYRVNSWCVDGTYVSAVYAPRTVMKAEPAASTASSTN